MNFLEASAVLREFRGQGAQNYRLVMSGTPDAVIVYLRAQAALRGVKASIETIAFNTLQQFILAEPPDDKAELFLLSPWDFSPQGDWRSGVAPEAGSRDHLRRDAANVRDLLARRTDAVFAYLPAPRLPIFPDDTDEAAFDAELRILACELDGLILDPRLFSLSAYLTTGSLADGTKLGELAEHLDGLLLRTPPGAGKVLVTDLDNVLWSGLAAEDGPDGIKAGPDGPGYPHYLYQSFLKRLKNDGVLLAAVSRNSPDDAMACLSVHSMVLHPDDFITVVASYSAKSAQIRVIADQLDLGLDAFVFIDDDPVERAEVSAALPAITSLAFPASEAGLPGLFTSMARCFRRGQGTAEDSQRTEFYRHRLKTMPPSEEAGGDTAAFLSDLSMTLEITDQTKGNRQRAVQLFNKTNQFNLNGRRFDAQEVGAVIASGGALLTATLSDRMGSHGEISALLISADGRLLAWVLSCRVFQRRVEHALLAWLPKLSFNRLLFDFFETEKNLPFQTFITDPAFVRNNAGELVCDLAKFAKAHSGVLDLFRIVERQVD